MTLTYLANWLAAHTTLVGVGLMFGIAFWQISKSKRQQATARKILEKAVKSGANEPLSLHPEVDPELCAGCGNCLRVCPEGDILRLIDHRAVLVSPTKCVGHGECEASCPTKAISLVFGTKTRGMDIPRITTHYETNVAGLYIAGELGGMGLIRNAVKQGHLAAAHALSQPSSSGPPTDAELLIIGAGPAGLAASLTAIANRKSYICIEQGSFGGTVYNFPRQKVVMTHPADLPVVGKMKFPKNKVTKEELLAYWNDIRAKTGLKVREEVRFLTLKKNQAIFEVETNKGLIRARKVILAIGVRGTPRKLKVPGEDSPKVAYNLIDPEQYQDMDLAVVGSGNAGLEAAQALAKPELKNRVRLLVRGDTFDRCNEENQKNTDALIQAGRIKPMYSTSVKEVKEKSLVVTTKEGEKTIPNHFLFIFAGAEMPHQFLMSLGIQIDKKFGESLKKAG